MIVLLTAVITVNSAMWFKKIFNCKKGRKTFIGYYVYFCLKS